MKPMSSTLAVVTAVLALAATPLRASAQGQEVWRCGAEGRSYSSTPCTGGRLVATEQARPTADLDAAVATAAREQALADGLRRERLQREAVPPGTGLAGFVHVRHAHERGRPGARSKKPTEPAPRHRLSATRPADGGTWPAVAPASRRRPG